MASIEFPASQKAMLVQKLKAYFDSELDQDIGQFECEFFLDFISEEIGAFYYNQGLEDGEAIVLSKMDDIRDAFYALEKPVSV